jgi:hypothetical protein
MTRPTAGRTGPPGVPSKARKQAPIGCPTGAGAPLAVRPCRQPTPRSWSPGSGASTTGHLDHRAVDGFPDALQTVACSTGDGVTLGHTCCAYPMNRDSKIQVCPGQGRRRPWLGAKATTRMLLFHSKGRLNAQSPTDHVAILQICDVPPARHQPALAACCRAGIGHRLVPPVYPPKTRPKCPRPVTSTDHFAAAPVQVSARF